MRANPSHGEETPMSDSGHEEGSGEPGLDAVRRRLTEIQETKRDRVRWNVSRKTAEMALVALEDFAPPPPKKKLGGGKARRRKRRKRLL
jgi:hypothetical protein